MLRISAVILLLCQVSICFSSKRQERRGHHPRKNLTRIYDEYDDIPGLHYWMEYAQFYENNIRHLHQQQPPGGKIHMLDLGVQSGGSSRVWRQYFGRRLQYTGIDSNTRCKQLRNATEGIHVEIGSADDAKFLARMCAKYGPFHLIVDDGAHTTQSIMTALAVLWGCLRDGGVYAIEDLHTMADWPGRVDVLMGGQDVFGHLAYILRGMALYDHRAGPKGRPPPNRFSAHLSEVRAYDSVVFLHYRDVWKPLTEFKRGTRFLPNSVKSVPDLLAEASGGA